MYYSDLALTDELRFDVLLLGEPLIGRLFLPAVGALRLDIIPLQEAMIVKAMRAHRNGHLIPPPKRPHTDTALHLLAHLISKFKHRTVRGLHFLPLIIRLLKYLLLRT